MMEVTKIIAGNTKQVTIPSGGKVAIELLVPTGENQILVNLGEGAVAALMETQQLGDEGEAKLEVNVNLGRGAELRNFAICTDGKKVVLNHNFNLAQQAKVKFGAALLATDGQRFELNTIANHTAANSSSDLRVYSALRGASYSSSHGNLKIAKKAKGANAFLASHALLLDKPARAECIPALEIEENDVKAGHSASTSRLSEEQIFYCTSRGIEQSEAQKIIVMGFLSRAFPTGFSLERVEEKWNK